MDRFLEARVADYMARRVRTVAPDITVRELEQQLADTDFNGLPVVEGNAMLGVVTKFDVLKVFVFTPRTVVPPYEQLAARTARQIMTTEVITFHPDTPLTRVLQTVVDFRVTSFPVLEDGSLVGMISRGDVVRALCDARAT